MEKRQKVDQGQGAVQRQTQRNENHDNKSRKTTNNKSGMMPVVKIKSEDLGTDKPDKRGRKLNLKDIDDEKVIPGIAKRRRPWNSVDFEKDDFF